MVTSHDIMRERLLLQAGVIKPAPIPRYTLAEMEALQWGEEWQYILSLMKNRMVMGGYRYGPTKLQKPREFDNVADTKRRLDLYEADGNMEHLVDAANICIIECLKKSHPNFHFNPTDDGVHAERIG